MESGSKRYQVRRSDLLYPELSFKINGVLFDVHNQLGGGHREKYYQEAVGEGLKIAGIHFREQEYVPLMYGDKIVGKYYLDFFVEEKVILELKRGKYLPASIINQTKGYLSALNLELALIACFAHDCVVIKRIVSQQGYSHLFVHS